MLEQQEADNSRRQNREHLVDQRAHGVHQSGRLLRGQGRSRDGDEVVCRAAGNVGINVYEVCPGVVPPT